MSWRLTLGVKNYTDTYNIQNKSLAANSTHCTDITYGGAKLLNLLREICANLNINHEEVYESLAPEDIEDWCKGVINADTLVVYANALVQRREMNQGIIPVTYTCRARCKDCGPIWLWTSREVLGCPWCWNRVANRPIPRP